ncbi:hypothetical protein [Streptomyces cinereoruber]
MDPGRVQRLVQRLAETIGEETTGRLLAIAEQAELPPRPRPNPR